MPDLRASGVSPSIRIDVSSRVQCHVHWCQSAKMSVDGDVDAGQGHFGRCQAPGVAEVGQLVDEGIVSSVGVVVEHR